MSARRHDHDAGGDPATLEEKAALRDRVWEALQRADADRFPGAEGRIPNFVGAEEAAEQLRDHEAWREATTVKANPDSPQWPVRQRALEDGKTLYMAAPRLAEDHPFLLLDPADLDETPRQASSIKGAGRNAVPVDVEQLDPVDLVVVGCVAVSEDGARLGKGGGFSDLEFAVAQEAGLISASTIVATTVHEMQVVGRRVIPMADHDVPLDLIVTPERTIDLRGNTTHRRPQGVDWSALTEEKIASVPLLGKLRGDDQG